MMSTRTIQIVGLCCGLLLAACAAPAARSDSRTSFSDDANSDTLNNDAGVGGLDGNVLSIATDGNPFAVDAMPNGNPYHIDAGAIVVDGNSQAAAITDAAVVRAPDGAIIAPVIPDAAVTPHIVDAGTIADAQPIFVSIDAANASFPTPDAAVADAQPIFVSIDAANASFPIPDAQRATDAANASFPIPDAALPDARPIVIPDAAVPDARPIIYDARPIIYDAQPVVPDARPIVPDARPIIPDARPIVPDARPIIYDARPADARPVDARPFIYDARPADARLATPDAHPVTPANTDFEVISAPTANNTVGYTDENGQPLSVRFDNDGRRTLCRDGHIPDVDSAGFVDCSQQDEMGVSTFEIQPTSGKTDGSYRVDVLHTDEDGVTRTFTVSFYVHRSLNDTLSCNSEPQWPSDDTWFAAATQPFGEQIQHNVPFTDLDLTPPTYQFGFTNVFSDTNLGIIHQDLHTGGFSFFGFSVGAPATFDLQILSLRHHFVMNDDNTLLLIYRKFESMNARLSAGEHLCQMPLQFGLSFIDCDAIVLNSDGQGFCMSTDGEGAAFQLAYGPSLVSRLVNGTHAESPEDGGVTFNTQPTKRRAWGNNFYDALDREDDSEFLVTMSRWHLVILRP